MNGDVSCYDCRRPIKYGAQRRFREVDIGDGYRTRAVFCYFCNYELELTENGEPSRRGRC